MKIMVRIINLFVILVVIPGCSVIDRTSGHFIQGMANRQMSPYTLTTDDLEVACATAQGMQAMVLSFTRVGVSPDRVGILMNMMAGTCAEIEAQEDGLTYIRAFENENVNEARDARIREKRHYAVASTRNHRAWQYMVSRFGEPGGTECPILDEDDLFYWLVGNLSGIQAVLTDFRSEGQVGVSRDIVPKAVRGLQCLDDEDFWGLPNAAQATLAIMMPEDNAVAADSWQKFEVATSRASQQGVRLAHAMHVVAADTVEDSEQLRFAIRQHAASLGQYPVDPKYQLLDIVATSMTYAISDRLWTEATGARTPVGSLGKFWDDDIGSEKDEIDVVDLLDDF